MRMNERWLGIVVAMGLMSDARTVGAVGIAAAGPSAAAAGSEGVVVEVDSSVPETEMIRGWVEDRAAKVVRGLDEPLEAGASIWIGVGGAPYDYRISVVLVRDGEGLAAEHQPAEIACACGSDEMLEKVGEAIASGARTLGQVVAREREEVAKAEAEAAVREQERLRLEAEAAGRVSGQRERYRPSRFGRAGIGVLGVGGAVMLSGIVMAAQEDQKLAGNPIFSRVWSTPGYTVLGIGAAVAVGGLSVLIVDVVRCRRDRARCGNAAAWMGEARWASGTTRGVR